MVAKTVREGLRDAIADEMRLDDNVFVIGEEVAEYDGAYKVTKGLLHEFGYGRVIDTPISEHGFTGLAIGAAFRGLRPVVEYMTFNFAMQALDQIVNSAAKTSYMSGGTINCPIVFRGPNGAAARVGAQHSQNYTALYSHIPGIKVVVPYSTADAQGLLRTAIRDNNPVIFLENEILYGHTFEVPELVEPIEFGQANILKNGKDVTIVTFGFQVYTTELAVQSESIQDIDAEIIDLRTIKPLDINTIIKSVQKTNKLVIVEEGWFFSGVGASIATIVMQKAFDYLDAPVEVVNAKDVPLPYAANLESMALPSVDDIVSAIKNVCYR